MELKIDESIIKAYGFTHQNINIQQIGSGHINGTYLLTKLPSNEKFVLQYINTNVFTNPKAIANNIQAVASFLNQQFPTYLFPAPLLTVNGENMATYNGSYWRLSPFVDDTVALDTLSSPKQAYEAAKQFGKLSRLLNGFDSNKLQATIIGFHDLVLRFEQFENALANANTAFKTKAAEEIEAAINYQYILNNYLEIKDVLPDRVMHHDTKISNVLLDQNSYEGVCVIDLDTLMPGKFISDLGDMMRTYLCEFSENETDFSKINIREDYFAAMIEGYLYEMGSILTKKEKEAILFSGKYIIYMQALRFLSDYLNGSVYYPIHYPTQNLDRAKNQLKLLQELVDNEEKLQDIINQSLLKVI
ncbi:phosphotransferase enzyme family protein [Pedobacter sp.]